MDLSRHLRPLTAIFRPPFEGLGLVVVLYFAWCYLVLPNSPILGGDLPDTDDYTYLNQVLDWMNGQGWYDNVQHRLNPPFGVPIHFSRLTQLPMVGIIYILKLTGLGPKGAAMLMAAIYPVMLLGVFFMVLRWLLECFVPKEWAGVTPLVAIFATGTMFMFQPGHIDHHGLNLGIFALALGCVLRMFAKPEQYKWALYAGFLLALSLTVALEVLPWLLLLSAWIGLWAMVRGGNAARAGLLYGLALYLGSILGLMVTRPPSEYLTYDVLTYSSVYVLLAAAIAVSFAGVALGAEKAPVRWVLGIVLAAATSVAFLNQFPDLIAGPYGAIDPALAQIILGEINEAQPLKLPVNTWFMVSRILASALVGWGTALWFFRRAQPAERWRWGLVIILLTGAIGLTTFYQRRFVGMMDMLAVIPLTTLLYHGWNAIAASRRGRARVYAEIGLLLLVGPLPAVIYPALSDGRPFNTGMLLFPANISRNAEACQMYDLERYLRDSAYLGDRPRLIMSSISMGPELLFRTNHMALSAPYHMDVDGNVDATRFLSTPYPEEAEAIARRRHVDLVVACRSVPEMYLRPAASKLLKKNDNLKDFAPHFIIRLLQDKVPDWLQPVELPGLKNFVVYKVVEPAKGK